MKTILALWFALCLSAGAALPAPAWLASATKAAMSSSSVVGPPVVYMVRTNSSTSLAAGTALTNIMECSSDANRVMIFCIDWYPDANLTNLSFNGVMATNNLLCATNFDSAVTTPSRMYYLLAPQTGPSYYVASAKFDTTLSEIIFTTIVLTNAAQTSTFGIATNAYSATLALTNTVQTATNEIVIVLSSHGIASGSPTCTWRSDWTKVSDRLLAGCHSSGVAWMLGLAVPVTNALAWTAAGTTAGIGVSVRGINQP